MIGGVLLGVGVVSAFGTTARIKMNVRCRPRRNSAHMTAALQMNDESKTRQIADGIIKNYPSSPYADQAQLTLARIDVEAASRTRRSLR